MKEYLGDGVYAELQDNDLILTTSNGMRDTNTIVLEPAVLQALELYIEKVVR
jgi:hypothetical protein